MKPIYRILIIVGAVLVLGGLGYLVWSLIAGPPNGEGNGAPLPAGAPGGAPTNGAPPTPPRSGGAATPTLKRISEYPVFNFWTVPASGEVFYLTSEGKVVAAKEGPDLEISSQRITALNSIEPSTSGREVLAAFGDPRSAQWAIFSTDDDTWHPLPATVRTAAWGANDGEVVATVENVGNLNLSQIDTTKTPPSFKTVLRDFRFSDVRLFGESSQTLWIIELPSALAASRTWRLDTKTLALNPVTAAERGLLLKHTKDRRLAFKFSLDTGFGIVDGETLRSILPLPFTTVPGKCAPERDAYKVYCFAPIEAHAIRDAFEDYLAGGSHTIDSLYAVNVSTGEISELVSAAKDPTFVVDAREPRYLDGKLYFVNRYDNGLYELKLQQL